MSHLISCGSTAMLNKLFRNSRQVREHMQIVL